MGVDTRLYQWYHIDQIFLIILIKGACDMVQCTDNGSSESPTACRAECCKVEAIVSVDSRGQMVLPKELRAKANIRAGDKLAATSWEKDGKVCCITLTKVEELADTVKATLEAAMKDTLQER